MRIHCLTLSMLLCGAPALAQQALKCGAHQHPVVEKDEEQGAQVRRCACDDGWVQEGQNQPCRAVRAVPDKNDKKARARTRKAV